MRSKKTKLCRFPSESPSQEKSPKKEISREKKRAEITVLTAGRGSTGGRSWRKRKRKVIAERGGTPFKSGGREAVGGSRQPGNSPEPAEGRASGYTERKYFCQRRRRARHDLVSRKDASAARDRQNSKPGSCGDRDGRGHMRFLSWDRAVLAASWEGSFRKRARGIAMDDSLGGAIPTQRIYNIGKTNHIND